MRKRLVKILEIFLILVILFICVVSILQSSLFHNKTILGYNVYMVNSGDFFDNGDILLTKKIKKIDVGDIVVYEEDDKVFADKIIDLSDEQVMFDNEKSVDKKRVGGVLEQQLSFISFVSRIIKDKVVFLISVLIPVSLIIYLEIFNALKNWKRKKNSALQTEDFEKEFSDEKIIEALKKEIKVQKKKNEGLEQTIQLPIEEIRKSLGESSGEKEEVKDDTMILFTKDEIQEVIKKELESIKKED